MPRWSHLQAAVVLQSAWRRRAAQVRDPLFPFGGVFFIPSRNNFSVNGQKSCRSQQRKGSVCVFFLRSRWDLFGGNLKKTTFFWGGLGVFSAFFVAGLG